MIMLKHHISHVLHVTNVTCHKYQVVNKFTINTMCYIFLEKLCNIHFNVMLKCHTSHVLHDPYHKSIKVIKSLKFNKNKCHMAVGLHQVNVLVLVSTEIIISITRSSRRYTALPLAPAEGWWPSATSKWSSAT